MKFAGIVQNFLGRASRFLRNTAGNVTIITGIASIPVIAAAGMAVDYARISRVKDQIQIVSDGAALASASAKYITGTTSQKQAKRVAIATSFLANGLAALTDATVIGAPTVTATGSTVSIKVKASLMNVIDTGKQDSLLGGDGGGNQAGQTSGRSYNLVVNSKARWAAGKNYVCLLALNESVSQALELKGTADITAKNCSVWDNSIHSSGLYQNGNATLTALTICTHSDNYYGSNYTPTPKTACDIFHDPLASGFATDYASAYTNSTPVRYDYTTHPSNKCNGKSQMCFPTGNNSMSPGVYNGGVLVDQNTTVTMQPGIYFIKDGPFEVHPGGTVNGNGVTIVLMGNSSANLDVQAGANLNLVAPSTGVFKSIAIAQHPATIPSASKDNSVIGGGSIEITGLMYFPTQTLLITGNGDVSVNSKYFAIVADIINIEGNGQLNVGTAANSDETGQPALPSATEDFTYVTLDQ